MTPQEISVVLFGFVAAAAERQGNRTVESTVTIDDAALERPKNREHGDWTSNVALKAAKELGMNPRALATELAAGLENIPGVASVDVAGPGFINIRLDASTTGQLAKTIVDAGEAYGRGDALRGQTINMEFVSANPTGPLHLGHTRWAALGDSMARVLAAAGADVTTEYYVNDAGSQIDNFGLSVLAAARGEQTPPNGYPGAYINNLAAAVLKRVPNLLDKPDDEARDVARELALELQLAEIRDSLDRFHVHFDVWTSERSLHAIDPKLGKNAIDAAVDRLREHGHVYDADGAVWVRTTTFGDDRDRVVTRGNGVGTYFAADAAYYLNKKDRGFAQKIYLLGADHHGYVGRLKALAGAAGDDPDINIEIQIGQLVNLDGARLSKRAGNIVELDDLLSWLGADAMRFWLARYPADTPLNLDGEKLRKRTNDNPVFYVQYAHARTRAVARNAEASGVRSGTFVPALLTHETESALLGILHEFPRIVALSAELREPHRIARYLETVAGHYHRWYDNCRVIPLGDEPITEVHSTRLWLNNAAGIVISNGLGLLGVSAPDRM